MFAWGLFRESAMRHAFLVFRGRTNTSGSRKEKRATNRGESDEPLSKNMMGRGGSARILILRERGGNRITGTAHGVGTTKGGTT